MSNLRLRVISAIVLAVVVLAVTWFGGLPFRVLAAVIAAGIFHEWSRMSRKRPAIAWSEGGIGQAPEALLLVILVAMAVGVAAIPLLILTAASIALVAAVSVFRGTGQWEAGGLAYAAFSGLSLAFLRDGDTPGSKAVLFLFAVVWSTDILAYFVGRAVGGPKLAPSISPGKTRSGALGGAFGGVLAGVLVAIAAGTANVALLASIALFLSVVSQAGDLFESWVKRRHGVKDSGWIIPGHGGVMDRVDGLVAAAIALYVIGALAGAPDHPASALFP